jgi:cobalamin biosynthesis protein CobD/CbiB
MKILEKLRQVDTVEAPPGFEGRVMAVLHERQARKKKRKTFQLSLAGALATMALLVVTAQVFFVGPQIPVRQSAVEKGAFTQEALSERELAIPITEAVTFAGESRSRVQDAKTIYILEQVSDSTDTRFIY